MPIDMEMAESTKARLASGTSFTYFGSVAVPIDALKVKPVPGVVAMVRTHSKERCVPVREFMVHTV